MIKWFQLTGNHPSIDTGEPESAMFHFLHVILDIFLTSVMQTLYQESFSSSSLTEPTRSRCDDPNRGTDEQLSWGRCSQLKSTLIVMKTVIIKTQEVLEQKKKKFSKTCTRSSSSRVNFCDSGRTPCCFLHEERKNFLQNIRRIDEKSQISKNLSETAFNTLNEGASNLASH